jgi:hypothetical protein
MNRRPAFLTNHQPRSPTVRATNQRGWAMRKTKVRRLEVLEKIRANRARHVADYREAFDQYKIEVERTAQQLRRKLDDHLSELIKRVTAANIKDGPVPVSLPLLTFNLPVPESHERDYDQAIMMLEMEVEDTVELESDQFACFVMDDWDWKDDFVVTANTYKSMSMSFAAGSAPPKSR